MPEADANETVTNCPSCGGSGKKQDLRITNVVHYRGEGFRFTIEGVCPTCLGAGTVMWRTYPVEA